MYCTQLNAKRLSGGRAALQAGSLLAGELGGISLLSLQYGTQVSVSNRESSVLSNTQAHSAVRVTRWKVSVRERNA